jgi:hypothetical protein
MDRTHYYTVGNDYGEWSAHHSPAFTKIVEAYRDSKLDKQALVDWWNLYEQSEVEADYIVIEGIASRGLRSVDPNDDCSMDYGIQRKL